MLAEGGGGQHKKRKFEVYGVGRKVKIELKEYLFLLQYTNIVIVFIR